MEGTIILFIGSSGSGKSTLANYLVNKYHLPSIVSTTTRKMRDGEKDGIDYHFKSKEEFQQLIEDDAFLEYATYSNNLYGTTKKEIEEKLKSSNIIVNVMELNGALKMKELFPNTIIICCNVPIDILMQRMHDRGDDFTSITKRVKTYIDQKEYGLLENADYIIDNTKELNIIYQELDTIITKYI